MHLFLFIIIIPCPPPEVNTPGQYLQAICSRGKTALVCSHFPTTTTSYDSNTTSRYTPPQNYFTSVIHNAIQELAILLLQKHYTNLSCSKLHSLIIGITKHCMLNEVEIASLISIAKLAPPNTRPPKGLQVISDLYYTALQIKESLHDSLYFEQLLCGQQTFDLYSRPYDDDWKKGEHIFKGPYDSFTGNSGRALC